MNILLTFAGNRDPFNPELVKGVFTDGPVLTLLGERSFHAIHIFTNPGSLIHAQNLQREIAKRNREIRARIHNIDIPDPTDYEALFLNMSARCREILEGYRDQQPSCFIATASGTPQMQTVWFLMAQSGMVPATLLKITPPRFLRPGQKAVSEISLSLTSFPQIAPPFRKPLWKVSFSVTKKAPLPEPRSRKKANLNWRTEEPSSWMKLAICLCPLRPKSCASCRIRRLQGWAAKKPSDLMSGSLPPPTGIWPLE